MRLRPLASAAAGFVAVLALALAVGDPAATPARAETGDPTLIVEAVHPLDDSSAHFIVQLLDASGAPVADSTVTVTPKDADPTTLPSTGDGTYQGPVDLPGSGTWSVEVASADPAASIDYSYTTGTVGGPSVPPAPTPTTAAPAAPAAGAPTATTATTTSTTGAATDAVAASATGETQDSGSGFPIAIVVAVALVVAVAGFPLAFRTIRNARHDD
jgi:hypothetical protein